MMTEIFGLSSILLGAAPPPLPPPPVIEHWLFERPFVVGPGAFALGLAVFLLLNKRNQAKQGLLVGGGLMALGVVALVLGMTVETSRERVIRHSRELVDALVEGDAATIDSLLSQDLVLSAGAMPIQSKPLAMRAVETFQSQVKVTEHGVSATEAMITSQGNSAATQFRVRAVSNYGPGVGWFRLSWRRQPDGQWRIHLIELLRLNGREPGEFGIDRLGI